MTESPIPVETCCILISDNDTSLYSSLGTILDCQFPSPHPSQQVLWALCSPDCCLSPPLLLLVQHVISSHRLLQESLKSFPCLCLWPPTIHSPHGSQSQIIGLPQSNVPPRLPITIRIDHLLRLEDPKVSPSFPDLTPTS